MAKTVFYVLVNSSTEGLALFRALRERSCKVRIAPAPRGHTACCGMSLLVEPADMPAVRSELAADPTLAYDRIIEIENTIDPHRDAFC